jgi:single-strand DNA-binding protein
MACVNKVILMGNLTRDPQTKTLPSGAKVVEFGLALNRKYKDSTGSPVEDTCFIDCVSFGPRSAPIEKYMSKGRPIFIEGRLKLDQWEDKSGGGRRTKISVVVENFQFVDSPGRGGDSSAGSTDAVAFTNEDIPF